MEQQPVEIDSRALLQKIGELTILRDAEAQRFQERIKQLEDEVAKLKSEKETKPLKAFE